MKAFLVVSFKIAPLVILGMMVAWRLCWHPPDVNPIEIAVFVTTLTLIVSMSVFDWPRVMRSPRILPPVPDAPRRPPVIIGLSGRSGAGKDAVADVLVRRAGFVKLAYATPLKCAVQTIFGFSNEQLWGTQAQRAESDPFWGVTPRRVLQTVGTELFRERFGQLFPEIGNRVWLMVMQHRIAQHPGSDIVITDVRFENELEPLGKSGVSWCIRRHSQDDLLAGISATHASENQTFRIDKTIPNDGTLEDLERVTMQALAEHLGN